MVDEEKLAADMAEIESLMQSILAGALRAVKEHAPFMSQQQLGTAVVTSGLALIVSTLRNSSACKEVKLTRLSNTLQHLREGVEAPTDPTLEDAPSHDAAAIGQVIANTERDSTYD